MKILIMLFAFSWAVAAEFSFAFVHIGHELPPFLETCLAQARLFNPECPMYLLIADGLIADNQQLAEKYNVTLVAYDRLKISFNHTSFNLHKPRSFRIRREWTVRTQVGSAERFCILEEFMEQYGVEHLFQIETDNMLYADFREFFPVILEHYPGIAATFDNERRAIAGVFYIANHEALHELTNHIARSWRLGYEDFTLIADTRDFHRARGERVIRELPIMLPSYLNSEPLTPVYEIPVKDPMLYCQHIDAFRSIFDAAAFGQYLGGTPQGHKPGFCSGHCIFNPSKCPIEWREDGQGRKVPFVTYKGESIRLNNLHIHKKNLEDFVS